MSVTFFMAACLVLPPSAAADVVVGQVSDFEDGTTQGWVVNILGIGAHPAPPANVLGGPAGADDNYLRLTSFGGGGAGSRLVAINLSPLWTGNYIAAGVNAIGMDLTNLGTTDLYLRLLFEDPTMGPPTNIAFSTDPIFLPAGSGWTPATFLVGPGFLTAGLGTVNAALTNTTAIRIYHSPTAGFPGPASAAVLGVDNITAAAVPEPASLVCVHGLAGWAPPCAKMKSRVGIR
ncbi:MAG: hypothetical protein WKF30_05790 [Pyrinomonadaceae bacterium]